VTDGREALHDLEAAIGPLPQTTAEIREAEDRGQVATYAKWPIALVRGEGCRVWDAAGKSYLDLYGGHAVCLAGHGHPRLVAAISAQARRLVFYSQVVSSDVRAAAVTALARLAPAGLARVFLCNSGTEANETALKIARKHAKRMRVVSLQDGFHGRTLGSLAATGLGKYRDPAYPIPTVHDFVPYDDVPALEKAIGPETAAVIVEPIPSMGGIRVADAAWFRRLRSLCTERGALLVFDEVQTGFGRTGNLFAIEHYSVEPDLMVVAKSIAAGLPLSGVVGRQEIMDAPGDSAIGGTYVGNPVAQAVALAVLDVIDDEGLVERAVSIGEVIRARMLSWQERFAAIGDVRGLGAMLAIEFVGDRATRAPAPELATAVCERALSDGLLLLRAGIHGNCIRVLVPLVIGDGELEEALDVWEHALAATLGPDGERESDSAPHLGVVEPD
jgi:4-aminobutyrate aminotransferase/(S)-3-amino-2-methylpropionate transaminase